MTSAKLLAVVAGITAVVAALLRRTLGRECALEIARTILSLLVPGYPW